jgi:nitrile hydratase accessory protein
VDKSQLAVVPNLPIGEDGPLFAEPWQAQAFAMAVRLSAEGHFTWPEWVSYLSAEIAAGPASETPDHLDIYYRHWLAALEKLVADKGLASSDEMALRKEDWRHAYLNTPHGKPIQLGAAQDKPD